MFSITFVNSMVGPMTIRTIFFLYFRVYWKSNLYKWVPFFFAKMGQVVRMEDNIGSEVVLP